ncbi:hypothetical protein Poly30_00770 [Planctomycetes bacterium Poly30]|uniref:Uncharacterized protein n=1 Tax=Saltatorellus ferox TaxID=2528018 RepID=A0A518EKH8_9BACT|nr:hypothetical protein Poly30_00770 [Planctomycetes bacterium Poly30]
MNDPDDPIPTDLDGALAGATDVEVFDAGDRGCGELALELRMRIQKLPEYATLMLVTTDAGAPEDVPAWARLTGNVLLAAAPPRFLIERRLPENRSPDDRSPDDRL